VVLGFQPALIEFDTPSYVVLPFGAYHLRVLPPIVFDLYKILTLTNVNKFPFVSLNRIFALTLRGNKRKVYENLLQS